MRFDVVTLFPELFGPFLECGVTRRAYESGRVQVRLWNPRDFAEGNYRRVDDRPFGGGPGMVMMAPPLARCLEAIRADRPDRAPVVLFSPVGHKLDHAGVTQWSAGEGAILLCGRYEGVDQRFIDNRVDREISIGDYIVTGGELPAMVLIDAVARHIPGALGDEASPEEESFADGLLEHPQYTRPAEYNGWPVPEVLLSGHHANIEKWKREQREQRTRERRPDLLQ